MTPHLSDATVETDNIEDFLILIVDDLEFNIGVLKELLESNGFKNVVTAADGNEAFEKALKFHPQLIITDIVMPGMDGYELCTKLRAHQELSDTPLLIQTAITVPEEKAKAFEVGATDFITKPLDAKELIARVKVHLEKQKLLNELKKSKVVLEKDLEEARQMQRVIIPEDENVRKIEFAYKMGVESLFLPSETLGGDFWGVEPISNTKVAIYIYDFSGHGVTAALNGFRLHTLMHERLDVQENPGAYLSLLNNSLTRLLSKGHFATMFYGVIDIQENRLSYATAACPHPVLYSADDNKVSMIDGSGFPLGVEPNLAYITQTASFLPNDFIFLYSDALLETGDAKGKFFSEQNFHDYVKKRSVDKKDVNPPEIFESLITDFSKERKANLNDDFTVILFYRKLLEERSSSKKE